MHCQDIPNSPSRVYQKPPLHLPSVHTADRAMELRCKTCLHVYALRGASPLSSLALTKDGHGVSLKTALPIL